MINLQKNENLALLNDRLMVGLGWDTRCDIDTHAIITYNNAVKEKAPQGNFFAKTINKMFGTVGKIFPEKEEIYYANRNSYDNCVVLHNDNLTGDGDGDDETMTIDLREIADKAVRIDIKAEIYSGVSDFSKVDGAYIRIYSQTTNQVICEHKIPKSHGKSYLFGHLEKIDRNWVFFASC